MATSLKTKERGSNYGGENHGVRVQYADGTWGFIAGLTIADPSDPLKFVEVRGQRLSTSDENTLAILSCLQQLLEEQRKTNMFLEGLTQ